MELHQAQWVLAREPRTPRLFHYFKDRYAVMLLSWRIGEGRSVRELRASELGPLLDKPIFAPALRAAAGGVLRRSALERIEPAPSETYRVALGTWGDPDGWCPCCDQTSRPGLNIVLQLCFTRHHNRAYRGLLGDVNREFPFLSSGHPNAPSKATLSWARLDVAFDASEAIIEEVQSDWVKNAERLRKLLDAADDSEARAAVLRDFGVEATPSDVSAYVSSVLEPHARTWPEATLSAALELLRELGIRRVFYNTFETGCFLKELDEASGPPRQLYSALPRRFCFRRTRERPRALTLSRHPRVRDKLQRGWLEWFFLEL